MCPSWGKLLGNVDGRHGKLRSGDLCLKKSFFGNEQHSYGTCTFFYKHNGNACIFELGNYHVARGYICKMYIYIHVDFQTRFWHVIYCNPKCPPAITKGLQLQLQFFSTLQLIPYSPKLAHWVDPGFFVFHVYKVGPVTSYTLGEMTPGSKVLNRGYQFIRPFIGVIAPIYKW